MALRIKVYTQKSSIKFIKDYSKLWQLDSLGVLGYRDQIWFHIKETPYYFEGVSWEKVKESFGKPNVCSKVYIRIGNSDYHESYIYYCTYAHLRNDGFSKLGYNSIKILVNPESKKIYKMYQVHKD